MIQIIYVLVAAEYDEHMKNAYLICSAMAVLFSTAQPAAAAACTVCHSKNPKMVSMHKALLYKDCFKCHGPASNRKAPNSRDEMMSDPLCVSCHKKETAPPKQP